MSVATSAAEGKQDGRGATATVDEHSGTKPTVGLGFQYDVGIKGCFFWRGELQRYTVDPDKLTSNALWIGGVYRR